MRSRNSWLVFIILLVAFCIWVDVSNRVSIVNPFTDKILVDQNTEVRRGLGRPGGLQTC
jgi:hypothetical protein